MQHPALNTGKKDFYRALFSLAIPIGLQNLLLALIGASDALMLGRLSQDAVAAVSLANQIAFIMNLFSSAVIGGGGALMAQYCGKNDHQMVKNLFYLLFKWVLGISFIFFMLAMFLPTQLMSLYTPDPALISIGSSYLRIVCVSYLFSGITQLFFMAMKLDGKAKVNVVISIVTLVCDVAIDYFLIYGNAGAPKLGANGSAYSTVFVEFLALIWCVVVSCRKGILRPSKASFVWTPGKITKDLLQLILPMLGSSLAWGVGFSLHSLMMGHLGSDAAAAASIASVVQELVTCVCKGISAGAGIMLGNLLGQSLFDQARTYGKWLCRVSVWVGCFHMLLLALVGPLMVQYFLLTDVARQYLVYMLLYSALYVFAFSINTVIVCGIFPAGGDARYDAISVFLAAWCFALPISLLGTFVFHWPVLVVYLFMCADEIVKLPWLYPRYKRYLWLTNLTREDT